MVQTKEIGEVYVASNGDVYTAPAITPETIEKTRDNVYGRGISTKLRNLIFPEEYTITVKNPDEDIDEELTTIFTNMCNSPDVRLWAKMQVAYDDIVWHGISIFNDVWGYNDSGYYVLKSLRHLPAETFADEPAGLKYTYAKRLKGVAVRNGKIEYWQTLADGSQVEIKNACAIKDPTAKHVDGESIILPLMPVIEMLRYTWNAQMQQVNRTGAKILFIKISNPKPAGPLNGNVSDIDYAHNLLRHWGKDTAFLLRENMELIDTQIKDDSNNLQVIDALYNTIVDYVSPAGFISRRGDSALGGGEKEREKLLSQTVSSIHSWIEEQFELIISRFFEYNQFDEGYKVYINIPSPRVDMSEMNLRRAELATKNNLLPPSRILELLGQEQLSDDEKAELEEWIEKRKQSAPEPDSTFNIKVLSERAAETFKAEDETEERLTEDVDEWEKEVLEILKGEE